MKHRNETDVILKLTKQTQFTCDLVSLMVDTLVAPSWLFVMIEPTRSDNAATSCWTPSTSSSRKRCKIKSKNQLCKCNKYKQLNSDSQKASRSRVRTDESESISCSRGGDFPEEPCKTVETASTLASFFS